MTRIGLLALAVIVISAFGLSSAVDGEGAATARADPGVLMGAPQKEHWEDGSAECKNGFEECSDEISQGQFVAWPFVAEHTGTVEAIFAVLDGSNYGTNTGSEVGIYANRTYHYAEIDYDDAFENEKGGCDCTWTPDEFMKYESEIPPENPGRLLGTSGKVAESEIKTEQFTEFKLEHPVKVVKGVRYWLANTTFQNYPLLPGEQGHVYQKFVHERESSTEGQPWGVYSNEPSDWEEVARPLKELPSPETTKINCEECDTEGWLQEEPKGEHMTNSNREGQEEGGQTFSYASGKIEEGPQEEAPAVSTQAPSAVTQTAATFNGTVDPNGAEVTDCRFEYGPTSEYGSSVPCSPAPGSGKSPVAVSAEVAGLSADSGYHYRVAASNAGGRSGGADEAFETMPPPTVPVLPTMLNEQGPGSPPPATGGNATPPPSDTKRAPVPDAQFVSRALTAGSTGLLVAKISCPADETTCAGAVTLKTLTAVLLSAGAHSTMKPKATVLMLARGTFTIAGGQTAAIGLRLSTAARTLLARAHLLRVRATLAAHDPAGATHSSLTLLTISAAKATHRLR